MDNDIQNQYEAVKGALSRLEDEVYALGALIRPKLEENDDESSLADIYDKIDELKYGLGAMMYNID